MGLLGWRGDARRWDAVRWRGGGAEEEVGGDTEDDGARQDYLVEWAHKEGIMVLDKGVSERY